MRWQRVAQAAIAVFVIGFIALLVTTLRRERTAPSAAPPPERLNPISTAETRGDGTYRVADPSGRDRFVIDFRTHVALADGRSQLQDVKATINRGEQPFVITARQADVTPGESGNDSIKEAVFKGDVHVTSTGGLEIKSEEARYTDADGVITIPGHVEFKKGRTSGDGSEATYDQNREVFWIRRDAQITVAPAADGTGALKATASAIGMARLEHYIRLEGNGRIAGEGRTAEANDIVIHLTEDDERVRALELRGNSSVTGEGAGARTMSARDIDMTYAEDGRTLQHARLIENAVLQLPADGGPTPKRIAASTIDVGLAADGSTITSLVANDRVQVDLPGDATAPDKRINSATLNASGAGGGLQSATFDGGVEYRETRAARRNVAAIDRTATSRTLVAQTAPGLGAIQRAEFRGNVTFSEPPDFVAEAPLGIYDIARDRLDLMPGEGLPGPPSPRVTQGNVAVAARTIQFGLASRELSADTKVRSTIQPQRSSGRSNGRSADQSKVPSVLSQDEPVNVTSNRLTYKGKDSAAVYTGNAKLWQGNDTTIKAPTITIEEKTGNLTAAGGVTTSLIIEDSKDKASPKKRETTLGRAESFAYDDAKRVATYTGKAKLVGPQGDVEGEKIELFLKPQVNELERAEAYGPNGAVQVTEGNRLAKGSHLTYTASDDRYLMIGTPVEIIEAKDGVCRLSRGMSATFNRATESATISGALSGNIPAKAETLKACPPGLGR